ncbi:MAG TPA: 3'-5' exonuclease [Candidatus Limnocylindria bacterium]|nr:3'-5' exonuclease [Candidatus Limnocylindria bacterium]
MTHPRPRQLLAAATFVAFDLETTGMDPRLDRVVALGAVRFTYEGEMSATYDELVHPGRRIPPQAVAVHGIDDESVRGRPALEDVLPRFRAFVGEAVPVTYMGAFDLAFLRGPLRRARQPALERVLDTAVLASRLLAPLPELSLEALCARLRLSADGRHTAVGDARLAARIFLELLPLLHRRGARTLHDALDWGDVTRATV